MYQDYTHAIKYSQDALERLIAQRPADWSEVYLEKSLTSIREQIKALSEPVDQVVK